MVPALRVNKSFGRLGSWALRFVFLALVTVTLTACDKCGNNIFRSEAGMFVCKGERPQ